MAKSKVLTSAKVVCYINGKPVGRVTSFRFTSDTPWREIIGVDQNTPFEFAPITTRCSGSLTLIRTVRDGGIEALGMTTHTSQLSKAKYCTLTLVDRTTDTIIFRADSCVVSNQSWDAPTRGLVTGSVSFMALGWSNECEVG